MKDVDAGKFDRKIELGKTELTAEELKELEEERKKLQEEIAERREEFLEKANEILQQTQGKERHEIIEAMNEAEIPTEIQNEVLPEEEEKKPEGEAKPTEEAKSEEKEE